MPAASGDQQVPRSEEVFISYSRKDKVFVRRLYEALKRRDREAWVDWEDIRPTEEFMQAIYAAIEGSDTFIFVLTPDSVTSVPCGHEIAHAAAHNKRMVPIIARDVNADTVPEALAKLNWIFCRQSDDFEKATDELISALDTDLKWVHAHTRLLVRAREWETKGKDKSYLLAGTDLDEAERWLANSGVRKPLTTPLQVAYVVASRQRATQLQKNQLRGFYLVSIIYSVLQTVVSYLLVFDEISETGLIFLSPIWVLGLVFGIFGLTIGRTSMKRSLIATVVSAVLLYVFFIAVWPLL
jgi:CRISPR/Cas system CSM-associated protein Csm2 small subunit